MKNVLDFFCSCTIYILQSTWKYNTSGLYTPLMMLLYIIEMIFPIFHKKNCLRVFLNIISSAAFASSASASSSSAQRSIIRILSCVSGVRINRTQEVAFLE